jgi:hypothetical protein
MAFALLIAGSLFPSKSLSELFAILAGTEEQNASSEGEQSDPMGPEYTQSQVDVFVMMLCNVRRRS